MNVIDELIEYFRKFPGVGPRQAERFVYYLLRQNKNYLEKFSRLIPELSNKVRTCNLCQKFYLSDHHDHTCKICSDPSRQKNTLMIVARDVDLQSIEKSGTFDGIYFIIGGLVSVTEKDPESKIRLSKLDEIIKKRNSENKINEIIIALNANPEGEHTTNLIKKKLENFTGQNNIKVSVLGRGLSTGTELEYSDPDTIRNALNNRD